MSDTTTVTSAAPGSVSAKDLAGEDWPTQAADAIERVVGTVREKATEPVERIVRLVVYGILAAILGVAALVLAIVALVRVLDVVIPGEVWSAHLVLGAILCIVGLVLWSKRAPKDHQS